MKIVTLPLDQLVDNDVPLRDATGDVVDLAQSIKHTGVLHPVHVERVGPGQHSIVTGHRRVAAARAAGHREILCAVHPRLTERDRVLLMLVENVQRAELSPIEEAQGYQRLHDDGMTQRQIGALVGRHQSHISKRLALLTLPDDEQATLHRGEAPVHDAHPRKRPHPLADILPDLAEPVDVSTLGQTMRDRLLAAAADGDTWAADVLDRAQIAGCHQMAKAVLRREAQAQYLDDDGQRTTKSLLASSVARDPDTGAWLGRVLALLPQMPADEIKEWRRKQHREVEARNRAIRMASRLLGIMAKHPRAKTPADAAKREGTTVDEILNPDEAAA